MRGPELRAWAYQEQVSYTTFRCPSCFAPLILHAGPTARIPLNCNEIQWLTLSTPWQEMLKLHIVYLCERPPPTAMMRGKVTMCILCLTAIAGARRPTGADVAVNDRQCMQGWLQSIIELSSRCAFSETHAFHPSWLSPHPKSR